MVAQEELMKIGGTLDRIMSEPSNQTNPVYLTALGHHYVNGGSLIALEALKMRVNTGIGFLLPTILIFASGRLKGHGCAKNTTENPPMTI